MSKVISSIILLLFALPVIGKDQFFGMVGGLSKTSAITRNFFPDIDSRPGFSVGLSFENEIYKRFLFGMDLIYASRSFKSTEVYVSEIENHLGRNRQLWFDFNYFSLPIKGGLSFGEKGKGFFNFGFVPSLLINSFQSYPTNTITIVNSYRGQESVTPFDLAGLIEIGGRFKFGKRGIFFTSLAYQPSFTNITNENYYPNGKAWHYGINWNFGFRRALNKD